MKKELKRIAVLRTAIVSGILYALLSLIFMLLYAPFLGIIMSSAGSEFGEMMPLMGGSIFALVFLVPILYGVIGGIFGAIGAWMYNLIAGWVGGYILTFEDVEE